MTGRRSYLVCGAQRTGSWMLCHALADTGVLGHPCEYFHRGDEPHWRDEWGLAGGEDEFLAAMRQRAATPNGVWGSKMMWNYFADAMSRLRAWPQLGLGPGASDAEVLARAFPAARYVWLRREDKLRQAISWWRADRSGQYALLDAGDRPAGPPPFDRDAITRLADFALMCESGWRDWFATHGIRPFEVVYEEVAADLGTAVRGVAGFLGVPLPEGLRPARPRLARQADHHTERLVELYLRPGGTG
jgi:LPS sulfotransferase NodH